jgi:hypothetical protein
MRYSMSDEIITEVVDKTKINIHFYKDWVLQLKKFMLDAGFELDEESNLDKIAIGYFNIIEKIIPQKKRSLKFSTEFSCPEEFKDGLKFFQTRSENGENLNFHQSRKIKKLNSYDSLLFDWGIYHMHLGEKIESDGFIGRTKPVLFCIIKEDVIYCIDIKTHGASNPNVWTEKVLLEIVDKNWYEIIKNSHLEILEDLNYEFTESEYALLRKSCVQAAIKLPNKRIYISPGGGYTSTGCSTNAIVRYNDTTHSISKMAKKLIENIEMIVLKIYEGSSSKNDELDFHLEFDNSNKSEFFYEKNTGVRFQASLLI